MRHRDQRGIDLSYVSIVAAMRPGALPRSPRTIACALIAASVCFLIPFKLSHDSEVLDSVEQPAHLTCSGAPVRKSASWLPGKAGALKDLHTDEKTVQQYIRKCITRPQEEGKVVPTTGSSAGVAIPSGGKWLLSNTLAAVTVLRKTLRSKLPVEVIYNGQEEYDEALCNQLEVRFSARASYVLLHACIYMQMLDQHFQ